MTKLERYLLKNCKTYQEAVNTYSKYYNLGNCMIRISDHYSSTSDYDLGIILPINKGRKYLISIPTSTKFYLWSTKEILDFLPDFLKYCELKNKDLKRSSNNNFKLIKITSKYIGKSGALGTVNRDGSKLWQSSEFDELLLLICDELSINISKLPEDFKEYLNKHACSYNKALNLYKCLYIDNPGLPYDNIIMTQIINKL